MSEISIIAIGGGKPDGKAAPLLKRGIEIVGKEHAPNVLIIPTAKRTQEAHDATQRNTEELYQRRLQVPMQILHPFNNFPTNSEIEEKVEWADIVYISGGDTAHMMETWKLYGIDRLIAKRALEGMVLSGISAGAIAPFVWGHSDSLSYRVAKDEPWEYVKTPALGIVQAAVTPHYNTAPQGKSRAKAFHAMFQDNRDTQYGLGVGNLSGVEIIGDTITPISVKATATVDLLTQTSSGVEVKSLEKDQSYKINEILSK